MRLFHLALIGSIIISSAAPSAPRRAAAARPHPSAACDKLETDYDDASKALAVNEAEGITDNSAIRENMRQSEDNNTLAQARMTLDLIKSNGCAAPTTAPSMKRYFDSALTCHTDMLKAQLDAMNGSTLQSPASCDRSKWVPDKQ